MKIRFLFPREKDYNSVTVRALPSGGTERAVIFLGESLQQLGHEVQWFTTPEQCKQADDWPDVVISQLPILFESYSKARRIFWSHHFTNQPVSQEQAPFARCWADAVVTLSQCHHDDWLNFFRIKSTIIPHGVWFDEIKKNIEKDPYHLIYASAPFRGLETVPDIFWEIKQTQPEATIAICSSMAMYGEAEKDAKYSGIFEELLQIPGVSVLGAVSQYRLYEEFAKASAFFYPCIWPETYCMAMDEAIAHGCKPLVSAGIGALKERVTTVHNGEWIRATSLVFEKNPDFPMVLKPPIDWLDVAQQWLNVL